MVTDIKEHKTIKKKLLEYFNLMPDTKQGRVSKTDWKLLDNQKKYKDFFYNIEKDEVIGNIFCKKSSDSKWQAVGVFEFKRTR